MKKGIICLDFDSTICKYETLDRLIDKLNLSSSDCNIDTITNNTMNGSIDFFIV